MTFSKPPSKDEELIVYETLAVMSLAKQEDFEFAKIVDFDIYTPIFEVLQEHKILYSKRDRSYFRRKVDLFYETIIYEEKMEWGVERPYEIAERLGIPFQRAYISHTSSDPSYPSGHAAAARYVVRNILDYYKDQIKDDDRVRADLFNVADRIALSRVQIGVHSLQDIREGIRLADITYDAEQAI